MHSNTASKKYKATYYVLMNPPPHVTHSYNDRMGRMDAGYPKLIQTEFPGIGSRVDAAFENKGRSQCRKRAFWLCFSLNTNDAPHPFSGYLYFSSGNTQTEYNYQLRRVLRTLLNNAWMDCN